MKKAKPSKGSFFQPSSRPSAALPRPAKTKDLLTKGDTYDKGGKKKGKPRSRG